MEENKKQTPGRISSEIVILIFALVCGALILAYLWNNIQGMLG